MDSAPPQAIQVVDYDRAWPEQFAALRARLLPGLGAGVGIEHIGSTAVPGLAAKPVIDLDVVVPSAADVPPAIVQLARLGYGHRGDLGIPGHEAFTSPQGPPAHHLYLCAAGSMALQNHLAVRDRLRADPGLAQRYAILKRRLAQEFADQPAAYGAGKTGFLVALLREAGLPLEALAAIRAANLRG
jgi:GrpB-like predicted nucleotidyltransferase (UPF0157 family)